MKKIFKCDNYGPEVLLLLLVVCLLLCQSTLVRKLYNTLGTGTPNVDRLYLIVMLVFVVNIAFGSLLLLGQLVKLAICLCQRNPWQSAIRAQLLAFSCLFFALVWHVRSPLSKPLTEGFASRLEERADIDAIRQWGRACARKAAADISPGTSVEFEPDSPLPPAVAELNPTSVRILAADERNYVVRLHFGGQWHPRWGVDIVGGASQDWVLGQSGWLVNPQYRYRWRPGVYVWHALEN